MNGSCDADVCSCCDGDNDVQVILVMAMSTAMTVVVVKVAERGDRKGGEGGRGDTLLFKRCNVCNVVVVKIGDDKYKWSK